MEFVLSLDSLLCPHTMGSGQEQKVAHQGKCRLWVVLKVVSETNLDRCSATIFSTPFLSLMIRLNS